MKLSEIKTREQLDFVADIWYNRTKRLSFAWQNSNDYDYIAKAFRLFIVMYLRVKQLIQVYMIISQPKKSNHELGGTIVKLNKK